MGTEIHHQKPRELLIYELLRNRKKWTPKETSRYLNLSKGYEGELQFIQVMNDTIDEALLLSSLLLEHNQSTFQIDCLLLLQDKIFLYEVKHLEGNYIFEGGKFYKIPNREILNPLNQLERTESLLRHLLLQHGINLPIHAYVVFPNPTFTLYQASLDLPIILPSQMKTHAEKLKNQTTRVTGGMKKLAAKLQELQQHDSPYQRVPIYDFAELKKGICCSNCGKLTIELVKRSCICRECGHRDSLTQAVLQSAEEFRILFPDRKITTRAIYEWCGGILTKKVIWRVLSSNLRAFRKNRMRYYE